jgi:hypothetical protein
MRLALALVLLTACGPEAGSDPLAAPDLAAYDAIHPYLEGRCATLDCHGDPGRPLRIFSETGLRAAGVDRDAELQPEERMANGWALVGVDPNADPEAHVLVLKPLAEDAGGMHHVGDTVWTSVADPGYRCLLGWLRGDGDADWEAACAAASDAWAVPPATP